MIFAVAGDPILHSLSPKMFNRAFIEKGLNCVYTRISIKDPEEILGLLRNADIAGVNITAPFKEGVMKVLDLIADDAKRIGAVNTVVLEEGRLKGYNTDFIGVRDALLSKNVSMKGKRAMVLGAGGAARAAAFALISGGADVTILNRTLNKAEGLASLFGCSYAPFEKMERKVKEADIIVSCLPLNEMRFAPDMLKAGAVILDANYASRTIEVRDKGYRVIDGREWLLFQGVKAFEHFAGIKPPIDVMRDALYEDREERHKRGNICIVGFMGIGKSSVAMDVSRLTGMGFFDVDCAIEERSGLSITGIFNQIGEEGFRYLEAQEVERIKHLTNTVIAVGGGAVLSKKNRDTIKENCLVIWLWADITTIIKRLHGDGTRPLLQSIKDRTRFEQLLKERIPFYADIADMIIKTDRVTPLEIAERISNETNRAIKY